MCIAAPGKVIKIEGRKATVLYSDQSRMALLSDDAVKVGDYVLVQMGIIIQVLTPRQARESLKAWGMEMV
jgi:hydrogenase expression/formation protein HypC